MSEHSLTWLYSAGGTEHMVLVIKRMPAVVCRRRVGVCECVLLSDHKPPPGWPFAPFPATVPTVPDTNVKNDTPQPPRLVAHTHSSERSWDGVFDTSSKRADREVQVYFGLQLLRGGYCNKFPMYCQRQRHTGVTRCLSYCRLFTTGRGTATSHGCRHLL